MRQQLTDVTVVVDAPRHGGGHPRHSRPGPNPVVRPILEGCEIESRNTYGGVPIRLLPNVWEAEDRAAR